MIPPPATTAIALEQRAFLRGSQKFEIFPDGEVVVTIERFNTLHQYKLPLWRIDSSPTRHKDSRLGSLIVAVISGACCLGMVAVMMSSRDDNTTASFIFPLIFFAVLFFVLLFKYVTTSINANVFVRRGTDTGIFIWFENPDAKTCNEFCETLSKRAEEAWKQHPVESSPQSLAGELAALKKLKDTGVLNDAEFERAKAKLLEQAEQRRIGFV